MSQAPDQRRATKELAALQWLSAWQIVRLIAAIAVMTYLLARFELLLGLESAVRDSAITTHHAAENDLTRIVIVAISQNEYKSDFGSASPLEPGKLIDDLIRIARAQPRLIAVDIDTSHPNYLRLRKSHMRASALLDAAVPHWHDKFIWARPAVHEPGQAYAPAAVLGLDAPPGSRLWRESGATAFPVDPDRAVRTYLRQFVTQRGRLDSLPYAVARRALPQETAAALQPDDRKRLLSLWGGPLVLAGSCVESNRAPGTFLACSMKAALANPAGLRDKIVIVSGIYREANDFHATANGKLPGVELVADALQTEAGGGGPVVFSEFESMLVGAVIGTILTIAYMMLGVAAGILVNIAAAAGLFFIFKYRPEYGIGSLFPIPVVFFLLYLYHIANEYRDEIIHQVHRIFLSSRARGAGQSGVDP